jgi:hypothetical protein
VALILIIAVLVVVDVVLAVDQCDGSGNRMGVCLLFCLFWCGIVLFDISVNPTTGYRGRGRGTQIDNSGFPLTNGSATKSSLFSFLSRPPSKRMVDQYFSWGHVVIMQSIGMGGTDLALIDIFCKLND